MKKYFIYVIIAATAIVTSCKNDESVGITIQPQEDEIIVDSDTFIIESENYYVPAISAQADSMILGEFYNETYGTTKAELLVQIAPPIDYRFPEDKIDDYVFEVLEIVPKGKNILDVEKEYIQESYKKDPNKSLNISNTKNIDYREKLWE